MFVLSARRRGVYATIIGLHIVGHAFIVAAGCARSICSLIASANFLLSYIHTHTLAHTHFFHTYKYVCSFVLFSLPLPLIFDL